MSAPKRKQHAGDNTANSARKRQKTNSDPAAKPAAATQKQSTTVTKQKSLLSKDQPAFPRGGSGPLTLLEKKQIRAKASRDAIREAEGTDLFEGTADANAASEDSDLDLDHVDETETFAVKKPTKKKQKKSKVDRNADAIRIESISYKRVTEGTLLLARVVDVSSKDLTVALPNNLTGFVPATAISAPYSTKLEKELASISDGDIEGEDEDNENKNEIDLRKHFKLGQALRVAVTGADADSSQQKESRRRINLTTRPELVNRNLTKKVLAAGVTIQVAVASVEDHGVIVQTGLEDGTTGFIAKQALPNDQNLSSWEVGSVLLCTVSKASSKGKAVQLSPDLTSNASVKSSASVEAYLPGTAVEVLLTQVSEEGLAGKVLGMLDVTADFLHSHAFNQKDSFPTKFEVGQKVTGRLIAAFPHADSNRLAFSMLDSVTNLTRMSEERFALSSFIDRAQVLSVVQGLGVYLTLPSGAFGFAHISRLSDKTVDALNGTSGPYKIGTEHRARVLDYNPVDGLYILSLQQSVLDQKFLRLADVTPGTVVQGTIEKVLIGEEGVKGLLVKLASSIVGHVSVLHLSDSTLKNPEKKFREGLSIKTRVLSVHIDKRRLDLTLKKSLVNNDLPVWSEYDQIEVGQSSAGTLMKIEATGAIMQFFGQVKGRLPVSEMSDAFIKDAREHFKVGQVLTVHALKVDIEKGRLVLTARDPSLALESGKIAAQPGSLVSGVVFEKSSDDISLRLDSSDVVARLSLDHISDGSDKKRTSAHAKIRVGQKLESLVILEIKGRHVVLSNKSSLRKAAEEGTLLKSFDELAEDKIVTGLISNITENRIFVKFAQGITGVINKAQIPEDKAELPDFDMKVLQAISARIVHIDYKGATPRFWLSMKASDTQPKVTVPLAVTSVKEREIIDPVDENIQSYEDLRQDTVVKARITSVKETQINVELAKGIQGRVDVSEVFDSIDDIKDRKRPLNQFSNKQIITVKILGQHDSRTYKFLPLSHRSSKNVVFELSARPSVVSGAHTSVLKLEQISVGDAYPVFVNNIVDQSLMVNVSPAVRGRIRASDVSEDMAVAANLARNFPVGSCLKAEVTAVDTEKNRLDLSANLGGSSKQLTLDSVSAGDIVAGRITKITERSLLVQLSDVLVGAVDLIDMADDYDLADTTRFQKNEIIRAFVLQVDVPNKKVHLSLRPSKILSSGLQAKDPEISLSSLDMGDIRRGFVANVADKGLFVTLARGLTAFIRVTNLSDSYLKEWKDNFQKDQLVQGKVIAVDKDSGHVQMSLKKSHVDSNYKPPTTINDLKVGDIVEAKVAKVESFGVFIVVANSENVRGLCHRSEIAEKRIEDVTTAGFSEGDTVKAKVLKIDREQRRINFGMKASYFDELDEQAEDDSEDGLEEEQDDGTDSDDSQDGEGMEIDLKALATNGMMIESDDDEDSDDQESDKGVPINANAPAAGPNTSQTTSKGLSVGGFDWYGMPSIGIDRKRPADISDSEEKNLSSKKKKRKPEIIVDRTGDLDRDGPQSVDDFERLLLPEPDNAQLWVQFMAFHMDLGDIDAAREVAEKALKSIGLAQETEKQMVWIALLNLENAFGDDESIDATLQRACQTMDAEDMHSKLASIYIHSGKREKADDLFQNMLKKFTQNTKLWVNYATFLFDTLEDPVRARALLPRALQALPPFTHFDITSKFAQLEFKTKTGVPEEGRTRFQGLISLYPKRLDLFNVMLDLEMKLGDADQVRSVFEQVLGKNLKPAKAKPFFQRWIRYENSLGDEGKAEEVEGRAAKWVQQYKSAS